MIKEKRAEIHPIALATVNIYYINYYCNVFRVFLSNLLCRVLWSQTQIDHAHKGGSFFAERPRTQRVKFFGPKRRQTMHTKGEVLSQRDHTHRGEVLWSKMQIDHAHKG